MSGQMAIPKNSNSLAATLRRKLAPPVSLEPLGERLNVGEEKHTNPSSFGHGSGRRNLPSSVNKVYGVLRGS